jgi:hypothetical protein
VNHCESVWSALWSVWCALWICWICTVNLCDLLCESVWCGMWICLIPRWNATEPAEVGWIAFVWSRETSLRHFGSQNQDVRRLLPPKRLEKVRTHSPFRAGWCSSSLLVPADRASTELLFCSLSAHCHCGVFSSGLCCSGARCSKSPNYARCA